MSRTLIGVSSSEHSSISFATKLILVTPRQTIWWMKSCIWGSAILSGDGSSIKSLKTGKKADPLVSNKLLGSNDFISKTLPELVFTIPYLNLFFIKLSLLVKDGFFFLFFFGFGVSSSTSSIVSSSTVSNNTSDINFLLLHL